MHPPTRRLLGLVALAAGLFCCLPAPVGAGHRDVYYLTHSETRAPGYYQQHGVIPLVMLPGWGTNVYRPEWDAEAAVAAVDAQIDGPFYVALWADNQARDGQPGGSTLFPWDDDAGWSVLLAHLSDLRAACAAHGAAGVVWDGEIYTSTPGNNGGLMGAGAWPAGSRARERGQQVRAALGSLRLGQYVLVSDAKDFSGWRDFWRGAYQSGDLLLDISDFVGADRETAFGKRGVKNLPGRAIRGGKFRGSVPNTAFWVYPWDGASNTDLASFSRLWAK
jgi:hypothetical protein